MWGLPGSFGCDPFISTGGTTYVSSVQHVTITIPTGAASATATISSVGSRAFILFGGFRATAATATNVAYARVELTNATTVTAYRNASSGTETVTVTCDVVDATSSLVASVQSGTVTIASGSASGTATVSSTNASNTITHLLGYTSTQTSLSLTSLETVVSLSGTTVTATRQSTSGTVTVGYIIIEFAGAALNSSVQNYQKSWTSSATTTTQSLTTIDPNKTLLFFAGSYANTAGALNRAAQHVTLTNSTTATITVNTAGSIACVCHFSVVEFASGVLASSAQRGTTTLASVTSNTSTITSVTTSKTLLSFLHYTSSQATANINHVCTTGELTNATTVTSARSGGTGTVVTSWEVAQFN